MTSRIPPLLQPHLTLPPEASSLVLLTGVLGASTNWLLLRHLHALLKTKTKPPPLPPSTSHQPPRKRGGAAAAAREEEGGGHEAEEEEEEEVAVLLVSFLRDQAFWKENLSRLGIDVDAAARRGRFGFVDGLSLGRPFFLDTRPGDVVARMVMEGVEALKKQRKKVVLVVDGLDFVLAATTTTTAGGAGAPNPGGGGGLGTAMAMKEMLMDLRENTHAAIITLAADDPLIKEQETTLEKQHAWFALSLAHEADTVLSLRLLDTGAAKDVSGVVRVTHGGARIRDHEYLYHVGGDGGVRVFERGQ
ncbi:hypothetical protein C8A00DRAFT_14046 [Chaetomidium leptoderma]|uniref:Uncharacterized protein n=1 Tax=Chaetomidium leptoderma TaxID=669021 RepID=A0AAN6VQ76_9PEZI|nr:hypothetical protein C8A00DRAFT_14046 [Chaetomidium leptoderma]